MRQNKPYAIPSEILEIGSAYNLPISTAKDSELKSDKDSIMSKRDKNSARGTRTDILNAKNKAKRKRSILGSKMYAQSISFTPKNGSSSRNDLSFNQTNGIDWKIFADKVKMYISKLSELINQKVNHNENAASNEKSLSEFKQLTWSKVKFSKNLDQLVENMFGDQNGYESMLQRVHHKQHQFYWSTNDEYRGYSDVQTFINENKANGSFNKSDSNENSAEKEYLVEMSKMIKVKIDQ